MKRSPHIENNFIVKLLFIDAAANDIGIEQKFTNRKGCGNSKGSFILVTWFLFRV